MQRKKLQLGVHFAGPNSLLLQFNWRVIFITTTQGSRSTEETLTGFWDYPVLFPNSRLVWDLSHPSTPEQQHYLIKLHINIHAGISVTTLGSSAALQHTCLL